MSSKKMKFKVSEFIHVFFNNGLRNGASAGVDAVYKNNMLFYKNDAAAIKIGNVAGPDAFLFFSGSCWATANLQAAIPAGASGFYAKRNLWRIDADENAATVEALFKRVFGTLSNTLEQLGVNTEGHAKSDKKRSADECAETCEKLQDIIGYLFSLNWAGPVEKNKASNAMQLLHAKWQVFGGKYESAFILAISEREHENRKTLSAIARLRNIETPAPIKPEFHTRQSFVNSVRKIDAVTLDNDDIARVMYSNMPHLIHIENLIKSHADRKDRRNKLVIWAIGARACFYGDSWNEISAAAAQSDKMPAMYSHAIRAKKSGLEKSARRENAKRQYIETLEKCDDLKTVINNIVQAAADGVTFKNFDIADEAANSFLSWRFKNDIESLHNFNTSRCNGKNAALVVSMPENIGTLTSLVKTGAEAIRHEKRKADNLEHDVSYMQRVLSGPMDRPRSAARDVERYIKSATPYPETLQTLMDQFTAVHAVALSAISDEQEYLNGGNKPAGGSGDYARVSDKNKVTTSRSVTVSLREARRGLNVFINAAPGFTSFRESGIKIGELYKLESVSNFGDSKDCLVIGCHTFYRPALELLQNQIDAMETETVAA